MRSHFPVIAVIGNLAGVRFAIPLLLIAVGASVWLAYGMNPSFADEFGGLGVITLTRRLQWVLLIASIVPCMALIVVVAMARARAWWLLGLSIVVAMLFIRLAPPQRFPVRELDARSMPTLNEARLPTEEEMVVGVIFDDTPYAFPYRCLYRTPIVQMTDFDKRLILIHSPFANSTTALDVTREVRAADLEYVASPGNSTLAYNRKYGQFIVGITGQTDDGQTATGVRDRLPVWRVSMAQWRRMYPDSKLMVPSAADATSFGVPLRMQYEPRIPDESMPPETPVILLRTKTPAVLLSGDYLQPANTKASDTPLVLWRDDGVLRVFNRTVDGDLFLIFRTEKDRKGKTQLMDQQTRSTWTAKGVCIEGELKGKRLSPVSAEENVYWGVCRQWWPAIELVRPEAVR